MHLCISITKIHINYNYESTVNSFPKSLLKFFILWFKLTHAALPGIFYLILTLITYAQCTVYCQTGIVNICGTFDISVCEREQSTKRNMIYNKIEFTIYYLMFVLINVLLKEPLYLAWLLDLTKHRWQVMKTLYT